MPPTVHEVRATTGNSADVTVTAPATVQAGDLLLAHVAFDGYNMPAITSVPAGWTLIADDDDGNTVYGGWWYRIAQAGDASASWVFTGNGNSEEWIAHCVRVTGHHPSTPINAYAVSPHSGASSGPWISPAVVTDVDDCLIIYSLARDGGSHSHTPPPGCVEIFDGVSAASGATAATKVQATAGDTGSGVFGSATSEQWVAITIAITPEPSGGPGMTPAPVFETDVEEDAPLDKWAFIYNVTVTTAQAVSPTHSLLFTPPTPADAAYVRQVMPNVSDQVVVRFYLRFDSLPTADSSVWWYNTVTDQTVSIYYDAAGGHLKAWLEADGYVSVGPVISAGQWYEIVVKVDISSTTYTLDWMVDGVAYATIERPGSTPDTFYNMALGTTFGGGILYIDDVAVYNDLAAYPVQAADILLGAPVLTSPALAQAHALVGDGLATAAPTVSAPAIRQSHALTAGDVAALPPSLTAPALSQTHELSAGDVTTAAPVLGAPGVSRTHELPAGDVTTATPVLGAPGVSQTHKLTGNGVIAGQLELAAAAVEQTHALAAAGLTSGAPVLSSPGLTHIHELAAASVALGAPMLSAPGVSQTHELGAEGVLLGGPMLGAPSLSSVAALTVDNLMLGVPVVEPATLSQTHKITGDDVVAGPPELETTGISQTHELAGDDAATGPPESEAADISQAHALGTGSLVLGPPLPGNPVLGQVHALAATPLATAAPVPGRPLLAQMHELVAAGVVTGAPVPGRSRFRGPVAVFFSARMPGMAASARAPRLTNVAARQPGVTFDVEEEICPRD